MRAILCKEFGPLERLAFENTPGVEPRERDLVINVKAVGLNFFDTLLIAGKYQYRPDLPFSPGAEISGTVAKVGPEVDKFSPGDRIMAFIGWGGLREQATVSAAKCILLPDDVSYETAAALQVSYGTALNALSDRADLRDGETLAVLGAAGGTGQAAIELGKMLGATVIAVASNEEKLKFCSLIGADHLINSSREDVKQRIRDLTSGKGADAIFDPVGGSLSETAFRSLKWGGRHLVIGFASGDIPRLALNLPLLKGASVVGVFWGEQVKREPESHHLNMQRLLSWLRNGRIKPHIGFSCPLSNAKLALAEIAERRIKGKAIVVV
jgi:NADPH2:quinone reductase